jgi:MFS family permease
MWYFSNDFHSVFWLAVIPAALGFLLLIFMVKEPPQHAEARNSKRPPRKIQFKDLKRLRSSYWTLIGVAIIFMFARVNETLIAIHGHDNFDLDAKYIPLIMMLYNGTYCLIAYPIGKLSDRINRHALLAGGMVALIAADLFLGLATTKVGFFMGVALWGIQMGIAQSLFMALIADMTPKDLRGTSFGFFYLITAIASVITGLWAGTIAQVFGEGSAFLASACIATCALGALYLLLPKLTKYRKRA